MKKKSTRRFWAILLSVALVFSSIVMTPADLQKTVMADETESVVTAFSYDFAYTTPGYADGTIRIEASVDGVYKIFWGDEDGNKLTKNGYDYSYLARVIVKDGKGSYNIISNYTVIPEDAKTVLVYKKDVKQYEYAIPEDKLFTPEGEGYTFGALSDLHFGRFISNNVDDAVAASDRAFAFLNSVGIDFVGVTGDLTSEGEQDSLDKYKAAYTKYPGMTVISCTGNHDSRTTVSTSDTTKLDTSLIRWYDTLTSSYFTVGDNDTFTSNLNAKYEITSIGTPISTEYRTEAGGEISTKEIPALDLTVTDGENVFIFFNEISKTGTTYDVDKLITTEQMDWLAAQLEEHKDKKVFVFAHSYLAVNPSNNDAVDNNNSVGDLKNEGGYSYDLDFKDYVTTTDGRNMLALFKQYSNVTMFSGHSHWQYAMQEHNADLNIGRVNNGAGATLVHLSSVTEPRYVGQTDGHRTDLNGEASEGTTVTIYDDCIVYNGVDFQNSQYEAYATYIIPTGDSDTFVPVKNADYREATDVVSGDEYLEAEDMTKMQLLKSTYNLMYGAGYVYSSKGNENTDGSLTDGSYTGAFLNTRENKNADQYIIVTLDGEQEVSNLKEFQLYFVNGLTDSSSFNIQLSLDGENYETIGTYTNMTYATTVLDVDTSKIELEKYKYIKLNLTGGVKAYGYQIREFAAIGYARNATPNTAGSSSSIVEGVIDEEDFLPSDYNLVYGADYTQSSVGGENSEGKLTDGKTSGGFVNTERNSSATNQSFIIDLGKGNTRKVNNIDYFLLYFQNDLTNATAFNVSVSLDGETYETVGTYTNVDIETTHFDADLSNVTLEEFRYVKLNLTAGKTGYGYQVKEFGVIGVNPIEYPEVENQASIIASADKNFALGKTLYVSTTHKGEGEDVSVLNDGKKDKYWSSDWDSSLTEDYVIIDLGEEIHTSNIGSVAVNFKSDNTYCSNYAIEYSKTYNPEDPTEGFYEVAKTKAVSWEILQKYADSNGYIVTNISGVTPDTVRYVKIHMYGHAPYGFQVYEVAVLKKELKLTDSEVDIVVEDADIIYTGSGIEPNITVTYAGLELVEGVDYTVAYSNNVDAGEASYTVTGKGNYSGSVSGTFTINPKNIADEDVELGVYVPEIYYDHYSYDGENFMYTGNPIIAPTGGTYNSMELGNAYCYDNEYSGDTVNPGTVTITLTGKGNYTGTKIIEYNIIAKPLDKLYVEAYLDENGQLQVSATNDYDDLVEGEDYKYTQTTDENENIVITVSALGDFYSGEVVKTIYNIKNAIVEDIMDMEYTGNPIEPEVNVVLNGITLMKDYQYTVEYVNNIDIGTATIIIKVPNTNGAFCGSIEKTFEIVKPKETTTETPTTVAPTTQKPTTVVPTTTVNVKKPAKVKIKKVKKLGLKKAKVTWKKIKGVKGYQIRYSTSKKMKKAKKKLIKKNKVSYTIKKLKKKKYYIQVRAYKVVKGKKLYGKWSKKKTVNLKK